MIQYLEEHRMFVLSMKDTAYAFGIDTNGALTHAYWGPKLPFPDDYAISLQTPERSSFDAKTPISAPEYLPWNHLNYEEPTLKVAFADGARDVRPVYQSFSLNLPNELVLLLRDNKGLLVELHYRVHEDTDLLERFVVLRNESSASVTLEQVLSAVWSLPVRPKFQLTSVTGEWIREFQLQRTELPYGKTVHESRKGHTSHTTNPFFFLDSGDGVSENTGNVWFGALAWSGNWKIVCEKTSYGRVLVSGGLNDFDFRWVLKPGESFTTPSFLAGTTELGYGDASRKLHRYVRDHVLPEIDAFAMRTVDDSKQPRTEKTSGHALPVLYNSWEATYFQVTAEGQMKLADLAAPLGVELFVIDDGWFGERNSDKAGLGDWTVNPNKFPNGLQPVISHVHSLGMKFGLWIEPEMVNADSTLYRTHPDWVYQFPGRSLTEARNQLVLDCSRPDVVQHLQETIDQLLNEYEISYLKWDMNRPFSEPGSLYFAAEEQQQVWVRHVQGIYQILKYIRNKHPHVSIETCSGGGGRVDLGVLHYTNQFWPSDNTDAYDRLRIQEGLSLVYPACAMRAWVTDAPQFVNLRSIPLPYRFHVAMTGALGIGADIRAWNDEDRKTAKRLIETYKSIRHLVADGDLYRMGSATFGMGTSDRGGRPGDWASLSYVSRDQTESVVFVFGRGAQYADFTPVLHVQGLEPDERYQLELLDAQTADGAVHGLERYQRPRSGRAWSEMGIQLLLRGDYPSAVIKFTKIH